ncbi:MAG TPA: riboflavin synthase [Candidatus Tumulicola sp.]
MIRYRGTIVAVEPAADGAIGLRVRCEGVATENPVPKESIAIDGTCLTATRVDGDEVSFDVVPESMRRTTLGERAAGDGVNVEYALRLGDRIGGHFVYGHVDGVAAVLSRRVEGQGEIVRFERSAGLAFALVDKAFVAIDGVSVTVAGSGDGWFDVALIPETLASTTLGSRPVGTHVNIEIDPVARYSQRT